MVRGEGPLVELATGEVVDGAGAVTEHMRFRDRATEVGHPLGNGRQIGVGRRRHDSHPSTKSPAVAGVCHGIGRRLTGKSSDVRRPGVLCFPYFLPDAGGVGGGTCSLNGVIAQGTSAAGNGCRPHRFSGPRPGTPGRRPARRPSRGRGIVAVVTAPVVDLDAVLSGGDRASTVAALHRACTETGFVVVTGHGLDAELASLFAAARAFFDQPQATKERVPRVERYGFVPHAGSAIDAERASDRTEYLDMGSHDEIALPEVPGHDLAGAVRAYQAGALSVGAAILAALAEALHLDAAYFADHMTDPQCRLRFLHYPEVEPSADGTLPVPTDPHTDYGLITLLATDGVPGLEVKPLGGRWEPVHAEAGQLVVNLGDMMARWTNDRYRSTPHRVVGPASGDRISIPFFVNPDPSTVVDTIPSCVSDDRPRRYEPVTASAFLASRIDGVDEPYVDRAEGPARRIPT